MADPNLDHIEPAIRHLAVPVANLRPDPANARRHGDRNLAAIRASLEGFRQQKPIVVDQDGVCVAGSGTLDAAVALGWTHVAAVRTTLGEAERRAYAVADNRTAELAKWDEEALAKQLKALATESDKLDLLTGFNENEIGQLLESLNFQPATLEEQGQLDQKVPVTCPKCGHEFTT